MPDILGNPFTRDVADPTGSLGLSGGMNALNPLFPQTIAQNTQSQAAADWLNGTALSQTQSASPNAIADTEAQMANWWAQPTAGMGQAISSMFGANGDVNSPYLGQLMNLAAGLKNMEYFRNVNPVDATHNWIKDLQGFLSSSGQGGLYGLGTLGTSLSGLMGLTNITDPNAQTANKQYGYVDTLDPNAIIDMISSMVGAGGFGKIPPETMAALTSILNQQLFNWNTSGGEAGNGGVSDTNAYGIRFLNYLKQNVPSLLSGLGIPGF